MDMEEATKEMIKSKEIYNKYKDKIQPNKKSGLDIIKYLENNYPVTELKNNELEEVVSFNIKSDEFYSNKLNGENPIIRVFKINNTGNGKELYKKQEKDFQREEIVVGIELKTSFIFVEGSNYLYEELTAFVGLDEYDIKNIFLVSQYIKCKEKFETKNKEIKMELFFKIIDKLYKAQPFIYEIEKKYYFINGKKACECREKEYENYKKLIEIYKEYVKKIGKDVEEKNIRTLDIKNLDIIEYYDNIIKLKIEDIKNEIIYVEEILKDKPKEILNNINEQNEIRIQISRIVDVARFVKSK